MPSRAALPTAVLLTSLLAACSGGAAPGGATTAGGGSVGAGAGSSAGSSATAPPTVTAPGVTAPTTGTSSAAGGATPSDTTAATTTPGSTATPSPSTSTEPAAASCAARVVKGLSASEKAGQLLMVGLDAGAGRRSLDSLVTTRHLGGVILLGGWDGGADDVRETTAHLESLASEDDTAGLGLLLAADQEGGQVQQLKGSGFSRMPSARQQGRLSPSALTAAATTWGRELKQAGITVNLAPVADTVPTSIGRANAPIGRFDRQYSSDPDRVATMSTAFAAGMRAGGVAATAKHFPGLGRITGNTDVTARGITDSVTTTTDPFLGPFRANVADDVELVMVGSAIYPKIDPGTNAVFSRAVVTDLLRGRLGYDGVVITDDVGAARAVASVPVAERAQRFVEAGGDIVLTARPSDIPTMSRALTARMADDPAFATLVDTAVTRVVDLKVRMDLATCP